MCFFVWQSNLLSLCVPLFCNTLHPQCKILSGFSPFWGTYIQWIHFQIKVHWFPPFFPLPLLLKVFITFLQVIFSENYEVCSSTFEVKIYFGTSPIGKVDKQNRGRGKYVLMVLWTYPNVSRLGNKRTENIQFKFSSAKGGKTSKFPSLNLVFHCVHTILL